MSKPAVIVTEPEYRKAEHIFRAAADLDVHVCGPSEDAVVQAVRAHGARAVVLGVERYSGELYRAVPRGGVLARFGVGHDGIDKDAATNAGLFVTNTPGVLDEAVAEHAMALILGVAKNLAHFVRSADAREWKPKLSLELRGKTLAVIGCGAIGRKVAAAASHGFGMRVIGCDPMPLDSRMLCDSYGFERTTHNFAEAVQAADIVSLHIPAFEENRHFICERTLRQIPAKAVLVNTSRGMILDECALFDALSQGRLSAAALDVFEAEPYVPRDPARDLRSLPNVLMTAHVGSNSADACERMATRALENVRLVLHGDPEGCNLVNLDVLRQLS